MSRSFWPPTSALSSSSLSLLSLYCRNLAPPYLGIRVLSSTNPAFQVCSLWLTTIVCNQLTGSSGSVSPDMYPSAAASFTHIPLLTQCPLKLHIRNRTSVEGRGFLKKQSEDAQWKGCRIPLRFDLSKKGTSDCWADSLISMVEAGYVAPHSKKDST